MTTWARLNDKDKIVEIRDFVPQEPDPVDIEHKGVRWRKVCHKPVVHDPEVEYISSCHELVGDEVHCVERAISRDLKQLQQSKVEEVRSTFGQMILDAMPDMVEVARICAVREEKIALLLKVNDYAELKRMT